MDAIDVILTSLEEYLASKGFVISNEPDLKSAKNTKDRVSKALHEYVNYKIKASNSSERNQLSAERLRIANSMNAAVKDTATSVKALGILEKAPAPLKECNNVAAVSKWMKEYSEWHNERKNKLGL